MVQSCIEMGRTGKNSPFPAYERFLFCLRMLITPVLSTVKGAVINMDMVILRRHYHESTCVMLQHHAGSSKKCQDETQYRLRLCYGR
jgi:hypothetical protein